MKLHIAPMKLHVASMKPNHIQGPLFGPFEVHQIIGEGAMGTVFAGLHVKQGVPVAIKAITGSQCLDADIRLRFRQEVQAAATLNHPGIVMIFDYGEVAETVQSFDDIVAGTPYYVMALHKRGTLRQLNGRVSFSQLESILLTLLDALAHAHAAGVIHRDIKPENILLGAWEGRLIPKLADFGLSQAFRADDSTRSFIGSPRYMAPEQIDRPSRTHGPWSDLYSLGCVAFELVSGRPLFDGMNVRAIYQKQTGASLPRLDERMAVPTGLQAWLDNMLAANPKARFSSAADAARALADLEIGRFDGPSKGNARAIARLTPVLDPVLSPPPSTGEQFSDSEPGAGGFPKPTIRPRSMRFVGAGMGLYGLRAIPLVGRDDELDALWGAFRQVERAQHSRALVVRGSQGCGKTRLVSSFTRRLEELGVASVLRASYSQEGGPADGLAAMLARHFRILGTSDEDALEAVREEMEHEEGALTYESEMMARIIRPSPNQRSRGESAEIATPEQRHAGIQRFLTRLASRRPVVVWLDDAQWGGDALELVHFILRSMPGDVGPILFVAVVTDDALAARESEAKMVEELLEGKRVDELRLEVLADREQEKLVQELLVLDDDLVCDVVRRTAGNPLFAVELVGDWVQQGVLEAGELGFVLRDGVEPTIPDHLHEVCLRRIDDVLCAHGGQAGRALELAAALGQHVEANEWQQVCAVAGVALEATLVDELIERRFARRTDSGWMFEHALLRESIERAAREAGRWRADRRDCAAMMEALYDVGDPAVAERFGRYAMSGGEYARALQIMVEASYLRRRRGEYRAAQRLLAASLECLDKIGDPGDDRRRCDIWARRSLVNLCALQPREAERWAQQALESAQANGWLDIEAQATAFLGLAKQWMGKGDAPDYLHRACRLLEDVQGDRHTIDAFSATAQGLSRLRAHAAAERLLDRELEIAVELGDRRAIGNNRYMRSRNAFFQQDWLGAISHAEDALAMLAGIKHLPGMKSTLEIMAEAHRRFGDTERAEEMYRKVVGFCDKAGLSCAIARASLGILLVQRGAASEARPLFSRSYVAFQSAGRQMFSVVAMAGSLACAAAEQSWGGVDEYLEPITEFLAETSAAERDLALLLELGATHLSRAGRTSRAEQTYHLALEQWQRLGEETHAADVQRELDVLLESTRSKA